MGIDWAKIESDAFIEEVTAVNDMMDFHDGQFTPRDDCVTVTEQKQQEALSFNDLDDVDPQEQEPLFTLMSQGFRSVIQKIEAGLVVSEADIFEEPELIRDNYKFCKYKFHSKCLVRVCEVDYVGRCVNCYSMNTFPLDDVFSVYACVCDAFSFYCGRRLSAGKIIKASA